MKRIAAPLVALAVVGGMMSFSKDASALADVIDLELGAKAGFGTNPTSGNLNPLGFGIGGRAGVGLLNFYGGVNILYWVGESQGAGGGGASATLSDHALQYGLELGYSFTLLDKLLTIRPQVGFGNIDITGGLSLSAPGISGGGSTTHGYGYLEPGVTGLVSFGGFFVGADANVLIMPSGGDNKTWTSFTLHGQLGWKF